MYILNIIEYGFKIPFTNIPSAVTIANNSSAQNNAKFIDIEIQDLRRKGCIREAESTTVINPLTVVTNSSGKNRLVLDCRHINECIATFNFRYENHEKAHKHLKIGNLAFTFDLKSAYHHVLIHEEPQEIFRIQM